MWITRKDKLWLIDIADVFERDHARNDDNMYLLDRKKAEEIIERIRKMTRRKRIWQKSGK